MAGETKVEIVPCPAGVDPERWAEILASRKKGSLNPVALTDSELTALGMQRRNLDLVLIRPKPSAPQFDLKFPREDRRWRDIC